METPPSRAVTSQLHHLQIKNWSVAQQQSPELSYWTVFTAIIPGTWSPSVCHLWNLSVTPPTELLQLWCHLNATHCNTLSLTHTHTRTHTHAHTHTHTHTHTEHPEGWKVIGCLVGALSESEGCIQSWDFLHCCHAESLLPDLHSSSTHTHTHTHTVTHTQ